VDLSDGDFMAAVLTLYELINTTASPTVATDLNLGSTVNSNISSTTYPVTVGTYGMSKILQLSFGGSFTTVSNIKMYISSGSYVTGEQITYGTSTTFHTSTGGSYADTVATTVIPTSLPSTANILVGGTITYTITPTSNTTDYLYLQSSISILASATTIPTKSITFTWDET